jgi:hypothetical protein
MRLIDEQYTACPFYGSRRMTVWLTQQGEVVNRKRVQRLMRVMGFEAIYPEPSLSAAGKGHRIYPYLLRDVRIERPGRVACFWSKMAANGVARGLRRIGTYPGRGVGVKLVRSDSLTDQPGWGTPK